LPELLALTVGDDPATWAAIGFAAQDATVVLDGVRIELVGGGGGIRDWTVGGGRRPSSPPHPNGAFAIDHVVMLAPDFDAARDALLAEGLDLRRERDDLRGTRMAFFRVPPTILELVAGGEGERRLWGLVIAVPSVDDPHPALAAHLGTPRDAVQPGRRIATLRPGAGVSPALAFMSEA
jgi:hypothetical protein